MKKLLSLILACVLCVVAMPIVAFADTDTETNDGIFGVITDAEGNVVEVLTMPRAIYVNSIYTIPAGGSFTSYQYKPNKNFYFGYMPTDHSGNTITDSRCEFDLTIELSNSIGADGKEVWHTVHPEFAGATMQFKVTDDPRPYCNGKLKNTSSFTANVRILALLDCTLDDVIELY